MRVSQFVWSCSTVVLITACSAAGVETLASDRATVPTCFSTGPGQIAPWTRASDRQITYQQDGVLYLADSGEPGPDGQDPLGPDGSDSRWRCRLTGRLADTRNASPSWDASGTRYAFVRTLVDPSGFASGRGDVDVVDTSIAPGAPGYAVPTQLGCDADDGGDLISAPQLSRDGSHVLVVRASRPDGRWELDSIPAVAGGCARRAVVTDIARQANEVAVQGLAWNPDPSQGSLALATDQRILVVSGLDPATGTLAGQAQIETLAGVAVPAGGLITTGLAWSGRYLAYAAGVGSSDGPGFAVEPTVRRWTIENGTPTTIDSGKPGLGVAMHPDDEGLIVFEGCTLGFCFDGEPSPLLEVNQDAAGGWLERAFVEPQLEAGVVTPWSAERASPTGLGFRPRHPDDNPRLGSRWTCTDEGKCEWHLRAGGLRDVSGPGVCRRDGVELACARLFAAQE